MTITAKFASRCPTCCQPITPGQKIEWIKGYQVRHTSCAARVTHWLRQQERDAATVSAQPASLRCGCRECRRGSESTCLRG